MYKILSRGGRIHRHAAGGCRTLCNHAFCYRRARADSQLRRIYGRRSYRPGGGAGTVLRISGAEWGGEVDDDQDADGIAGAELRGCADSWAGPVRSPGGGEAAHRRGAGGDGAVWQADGTGVPVVCGADVWARQRDGGGAGDGAAGVYGAGGPVEEDDCGLLAWDGEEAGAGGGGDPWAEGAVSG